MFPNTAFVLATLSVGAAVDSKPLKIFGTVVTAVVVGMWCLAAGGTVRGVWTKELLWPDQGEDRNEGGFRAVSKKGRKEVQV